MIDVLVRTTHPDSNKFAAAAGRIQNRFKFIPSTHDPAARRPSDPDHPRIRLNINDEPFKGFFLIDSSNTLSVSTWQSEGLSHYAGIDPNTYLLLCSLLGLVQWRAQALNPLLRAEDFVHDEPWECLFARQETKQDLAFLLEQPFVCHGCHDFYHCLGADSELFALNDTLRFIRTRAVA